MINIIVSNYVNMQYHISLQSLLQIANEKDH